ncbi:uncharacterized protein LOC116430400 isoform X2 [Nomia melanderi]|uniref:uncharacterized protein LOC116430400 isoform X2 n=2 Tax=Nomia melanderi TaxID=2448451 RepID=UPI0013046E70|nr:uncharacterized protein LOC116430400 isoform X1 [Nomia melanderi]XP_031840342.1 uncharacterized protein LOC116430400 isoform X1 [Nomia melanderi]XP_031840343.1 uncharacterized protein LOC116430400 isoform X1 [Nomia melanderi]XP_031840344.1 uncharacterized protein LOC116430400 isoform X1 [Nomia melanderi]XP_031840345.1 uncharacterized protein LOC116430400 isoform X1 [Nomia melanderi]
MRSFHASLRAPGKLAWDDGQHHDADFTADQISMYILREMRQEFPTVMANVHYTVLKKKWSNLLQQYKELRNPVHGDRNKADDVSWPFYSAIDELLGGGHGDRGTPSHDEYIDPHEFLCVSVTPEEPTSSSMDATPLEPNPETERRGNNFQPEPGIRTFGGDGCSIEIERIPANEAARQTGKNQGRRKREPSAASSIPRLPRATELTIKKVTSEADCSKDLSRVRGNDAVDSTRDKGRLAEPRNEDEERPRKSRRTQAPYHRDDHESRTDRRIEQIFEYIKRRDEENRSIMIRVMHAVETIANKL